MEIKDALINEKENVTIDNIKVGEWYYVEDYSFDLVRGYVLVKSKTCQSIQGLCYLYQSGTYYKRDAWYTSSQTRQKLSNEKELKKWKAKLL